MPALQHGHLQRRTDSGNAFSIIFGVIAAFVVVACAIWGFVIPQIRKKYPPSPSRTRWNDGSVLTRRQCRSRNTFPNHPAVKPLLLKPSAAQILPTYNPRIESPFPGHPEPGVTRTLHGICGRANSAPMAFTNTSSNGLFTPIRGSTAGEDEAKNKYHTVPRGFDAKSFIGKSADFGDAKDFILAVPEPLALKPRSAGRPPAVTRHLERYGTPHSNSPADSDKLLHPNKLFRAIQKNAFRSSYCSSTTMHINREDSDPASTFDAIEMVDMVDKAIEEEARHKECLHDDGGDTSRVSSFVGHSQDKFAPNASLTALHRLRSYRSLIGASHPKMVRAGTVTRPKTPVGDLRQLYGGEERSATMPSVFLPQYATASTITTSFELSSENDSVSTPATSPKLPQNSLRLLPMPLQPHKLTGKPVEASESDRLRTSTSHVLPEETCDDVPQPQVALDWKQEKRSSQGFYHASRRSKPPPPNIKTHFSTCPASGSLPRRSLTEVGQATDHIAEQSQLKTRVRASSIYSWKTRDINLIQTPTTVDEQSPVTDRFAETGVNAALTNPFGSRESIKTRIDEWNQRIEGVPPTPQLPKLKQISPVISTASIRDHFEAIKSEED
ncbi:hypothetical protein H2198_005340 [Neophaeococcomyces mojaviensis]|uniref:Uncharacterized protein n=1 Tax=Neophaeococcomyces mojaviensis TaxID=3383035 RepID=A0ACC3A626_9EURO|nr:hypothetical protein H2198_005340 [Knufia sp. JES_112]